MLSLSTDKDGHIILPPLPPFSLNPKPTTAAGSGPAGTSSARPAGTSDCATVSARESPGKQRPPPRSKRKPKQPTEGEDSEQVIESLAVGSGMSS